MIVGLSKDCSGKVALYWLLPREAPSMDRVPPRLKLTRSMVAKFGGAMSTVTINSFSIWIMLRKVPKPSSPPSWVPSYLAVAGRSTPIP
ncbi:MAG: hypothetical protein BWY06_02406 [Candidatus Latescibacteria bacterium ADurb.Bin168]|nr:MAG: hypothetical protein BWY06_02406 [Candidatus Latescibacteria bacterium ADurb.Bin168]